MYYREDMVLSKPRSPRSIKDDDKWKYIEESFK
jgi:hypothetical protein